MCLCNQLIDYFSFFLTLFFFFLQNSSILVFSFISVAVLQKWVANRNTRSLTIDSLLSALGFTNSSSGVFSSPGTGRQVPLLLAILVVVCSAELPESSGKEPERSNREFGYSVHSVRSATQKSVSLGHPGERVIDPSSANGCLFLIRLKGRIETIAAVTQEQQTHTLYKPRKSHQCITLPHTPPYIHKARIYL